MVHHAVVLRVGGVLREAKDGAIITEDKVTAFEDSVINYKPRLLYTKWTSPETGAVIELNPAILYLMEGNSINFSWAKWGDRRMYITGTNVDWPEQLAEIVERKFGIPYNITKLDKPIDLLDFVIIKSLDSTYLESIRNDMGMNVLTVPGAGITDGSGGDDIEGIGFHTKSETRIRSAPPGSEPNSSTVVGATREWILRDMSLYSLPTEYGVSLTNGATPSTLDTTDMTLDFAHCSEIYRNYSSRTNELTHRIFNS